jgi:DNA repair protein RadD
MTQLREYQQRAISMASDAYRQGARGVCLCLPTGAGKTVILAEVVRRHLVRQGSAVLYVHRDELRAQAENKLRAAGVEPGLIRIESVQTACKREQQPASLVIFDECHHFGVGAAKWSALPQAHLQAHRLGLTATPQRGDGTALVGFDVLVCPVTVKELVSLGFLVPSRVLAALPGSELADPVAAMNEYAPGRPTIVYCSNVAHAKETSERIGPEAGCVDGKMSSADREAVLSRFHRGELRVLTNVHILTEGWDCPRAEAVVIARGCSSAGAWLQQCGRGLRPFPGKKSATIIDCKGSVYQWGLPADDRVWSLNGRTHVLVKGEALRQCPKCGGVSRAAPVCGWCGYAFPPAKVPDAKRREMKEVDTTTPEKVKRAHFLAMKKLGEDRKYKPGWAMVMFKQRWGHWPPRHWGSDART